MKYRYLYFFFLFTIILLLFGFLYFLGIMNLFMKESVFFEKFRWLDFGKPVITIFYMTVLSIFFIIITSIMVRIIISLRQDSARKTIDDVNLDKPGKLSLKRKPEKSGVNDSDDEFYDNMEKMIDIENRIAEEANLNDRINELYNEFYQINKKLCECENITDLFDNTLSLAMIFSNCRKGSLMVVDKNNEIYIYKISGWENPEKFMDIKINVGEKITGAVAERNKIIFIENIDATLEFEFPNKNEYETKSFISLPIFGLNRVVAVLNLTDNKKGSFNNNEVKLLESIARLSSKTFELIQVRKKLKYNF
jgi:hypothetical protein